MPTLVDEQVVSLEFQNKNFEKNVKESLDSIEKLKSSLDFSKAGKGLETIDNTAKKCDFRVMQEGLIQVQSHISILDQLAMNWLNRMENKVLDVSEKLVKSMSTEQIGAGWDKYAEKTSAVQTIMAATASQFEDTATQMNYVNDQLSKLNWFTDETSYNFLDMVNNIGKFTSNQISLDDSVTAMQGISTWAAISGANVNEAGRAMYNLAQAIGVGAVKLMDWKSIENANMATAEFKQTAIDTAVAMGTLVEVGDGLYETLSAHEVSVRNFNEALKDEWFSAEVLIATLNEYGGFTNALYDFIEATDFEYASEAIGYIDQFVNHTIDLEEASKAAGISTQELEEWLTVLGSAEFELGRKSFAAAQQAKTFKEAIDSVKDAASTAWMNIFETIFGDFQKAKVLWTDLANNLYDIFVGPINEKANILTEAFTSNWDILSKQMSNAGISATQFKEALSRSYFKYYAQDLEDVIKEYGSLEDAIKAGAFSAHTLKDAFLSLAGSSNELKDVRENLKMGDIGDDVKEVQQALADLGYEFEEYGVDGIIGKETEGIIKMFQEANGLEVTGIVDEATLQALRDANSITRDLVESWFGLIENIDQLGGRDLFIGGLANLGNTFLEIWNTIFPAKDADEISQAAGIVYEIVYAFNAATEALYNFVSGEGAVKTIIGGVTSVFALLKEVVGGVVTGFVNLAIGAVSLLSFIPEALAMIAGLIGYGATMIVQSGIISGLIGTVTGVIRSFCGAIHDTIFEYIDFIKNNENLIRIGNAITGIFGKLRVAFRFMTITLGGGTGLVDKIKSLGATLKDLSKIGIDNVLGKIADWFERVASTDFLKMSQDFTAKILGMKQAIIDFFTNFKIPSAEEVLTYFSNLKTRISEFISGDLFTDDNGDVKTNGILGFLNRYQKEISDFCLNFKIPTLEDLVGYLKNVKDRIVGFFTGSDKEGVLKTVSRRGSDNVIINYLLKQKRAIENFISNFSIDYTAIYNKVNEIFTNTIAFISEKFHTIADKIKLPSFTDIVGKIKGWFDSIAEKLKTIDAAALRDSIIQKFNEWKQPVLDLLLSIGGVFLLAFDKLRILFEGAFSKIGEWVISGLQKASQKFDSLKGYFKELWNKLIGNIVEGDSDDGVLKTVKRRGGFVSKFKELFENTFLSIGGWILSAVTKIKEVFGTVKEFLGNAWTTGIDALFKFIDKIINYLSNLPVRQIVSLASSLMFVNALGSIAVAFLKAGGMFSSIGEFFDSARKAFKREDTDNIGDIMLKIANSIVRVMAAIFIMATFGDEEKLQNAADLVLKITLTMAGIVAALSILQTFSSFKGWDLNLNGIAFAFAGVAAALWIIVQTIKSLDGVTIDPEAISNLGMLTAYLLGLYAIIGILNKNDISMKWDNSLGLVAIAVTFEILADVLNKLNAIQIGPDLSETFSYLASLLLAMVGLMYIASSMPTMNMVGILAVAFSMEIILDVLKRINKWKFNAKDTLSLVEKMGLVLGALAAFLLTVRFTAGGQTGGIGLGIFAIALAMEVIVDVMKRVTQLSTSDLQQGLTVVILIGLIFTTLILATKIPGSGSPEKAGIAMLAMSAAILIVVGAMYAISKLKSSDLGKGLLVVGMISLMFGGLIAISKKAGGSWVTILAMAAAIGVLAAAISYIAVIPTEDLVAATVAIGSLMGMLALNLAASGFGGVTGVANRIASIIEVIVIIEEVVRAIKEVASIGALDAFLSAEAIFKACEGLAEIMAVSTIVGMVGGIAGIATGCAGLAAYVGTVLGIMWAVGEVVESYNAKNGDNKLQEQLKVGIDVISEIGELIGQFLGKIVGGFGIALAEDANVFMDDFNTFVEKFQPFIEIAGDLNFQKATIAMSNMGNFFRALSEAELNGFLTKPVEGDEIDNPKYSWGERLTQLAKDVVAFSSEIGDMDLSNVESAARAIKKIALATQSIPVSGGMIDEYGGVDIEKFGTALGSLSGGLKTFTDAFNGVTIDVDSATNAISVLGKMAREDIPKDNGFIQWIIGFTDYEGFSRGMRLVSKALGKYVENVGDISEEDVQSSVNALSLIAKFAENEIPTEGGWLSWLLGDNTIGTFATNLETLGGSLSTYYNLTTAINVDRLNSLSTAITTLATAFTEDFLENFSWNTDEFRRGVENLDSDVIRSFLDKWNESLTEDSGSLGEIGKSVALGIANGLSTDAVEELNVDPFTNGLMDKILNGFDSRLKDAGTKGSELIRKFRSGMQTMSSYAVSAARVIALAVVNALGSANAYEKGAAIGRTFRDGIQNQYNELVRAGEYLAEGVIEGIQRKTQDSVEAAEKYAKSVTDAMKGKNGFDEESPSKLTRQFGMYLDAGTDIGIEKGTASSVRTATVYAQNVLSAMSDVLNDDSPMAPSITPSFNLSAIRNGARSMSKFVDRNALEATVIANTMSDANSSKLDALISVANSIQRSVQAGKDIYLNEKLIIGRVNRKLGGYL